MTGFVAGLACLVGVEVGWAQLALQDAGVPKDGCILHLQLPPDTRIRIDGRDYTKREITWENLPSGKIYVSKLDLAFSGGATEQVKILVEAGRRIRVARQHPDLKRPELYVQSGHAKEIGKAIFSRNGQWFATTAGDTNVLLWDAATGQQLRTFAHRSDGIDTAIFSLDSDLLITMEKVKKDKENGYGNRSNIYVWDPIRGIKLRTLVCPEEVSTLKLSEDGRHLFAVQDDGSVLVWNPGSERLVRHLKLYDDDQLYSVRNASYSNTLRFRPGTTQLVVALEIKESEKRLGPEPESLISAPVRLLVELADKKITADEYNRQIKEVQQKNEDFSEKRERFLSQRREWNALVIWDYLTGKRIQTLDGPERETLSGSDYAFSPDGGRIAAVSEKRSIEPNSGRKETMHVWDVVTGKKLATFQERDHEFGSLTWSPSGARISVSTHQYHQEKFTEGRDLICEISSGSAVSISESGRRIWGQQWSPDGKALAYVSAEKQAETGEASGSTSKPKFQENVLVIADPQTGKPLVRIGEPGHAIGALAWSPSGEELAYVDGPESQFELLIRDLKTGTTRVRRTLPGSLWELKWKSDGKTLSAVATREPEPKQRQVSFLRFQADTLADIGSPTEWQSGSAYPRGESADGTVRLVDDDSRGQRAYRLMFTDGRSSIPISASYTRFRYRFTPFAEHAIAFETDYDSMVDPKDPDKTVQAPDRALLIDNVSQQALARFVLPEAGSLDEVEYVPQAGKVLLTGNFYGRDRKNEHELFVMDAQSGDLVGRFPSDFRPHAQLSLDGRYLMALHDSKIRTWDVANNQLISTSTGKGYVFNFLIGTDATALIPGWVENWQGNSTPAVNAWNPRTGTMQPKLVLNQQLFGHDPDAMRYSPDRTLLVTAGQTTPANNDQYPFRRKHPAVCVWSADGTFLRTFPLTGFETGDGFVSDRQLEASADNRVLVHSRDRSEGAGFSVYDLQNGTLLRSYPSQFGSLLRNPRLVSTADDDGICRLFDLSTGDEILRLARVMSDDDWIAVTPEGLFDGTEAARQKLAFRIGGGLNLVPVDRFFQDFYYPGLVAAVMRGERPMPNGEFADKVAPLVRIVSPVQGGTVEEPRVTLHVEMADRGGGVKGPWILQNGSRVLADVRRTTEGKSTRVTMQLALVEGDNHIEVRAASSDGSWEAEPAKLLLKFAQPLAKPSVYLLAVGVNNYASESMNLKYAAPDAEAIAKLFQERGATLYGAEQIHVTTVLNEQATQAGIRDALSEIAKVARPQDMLVIFLAGHGMTLGQRYYFIPHEFQKKSETVEDDVRNQGLAADALGELIARVPALKRVLIYDTCQSGGALPLAGQSRDAFAFRGALERLSRSQGVFTLAASSAGAQAQESAQLKHGVLTYALLAGAGSVKDGPLSGQTIKPTGDAKVIEIRDWFVYAQDKVPLLTKLYFGQEQFVGFSGQGTSFPVLVAPNSPR